MDPTTRLNASLEGRYLVESELGEGGMATSTWPTESAVIGQIEALRRCR
jgi:hypothetical protein